MIQTHCMHIPSTAWHTAQREMGCTMWNPCGYTDCACRCNYRLSHCVDLVDANNTGHGGGTLQGEVLISQINLTHTVSLTDAALKLQQSGV